jgi:2-polyprenyl-3-methyl-5-hydroxy-6-metoxy-1,4-benzoquinol methylase
MTLETLNHCAICNSENISAFLNCTDHFISKEEFQISRCDKCGFHFTNPRPSPDSIGPYYESNKYVSHSKTSAGLVNRLFHLSRIYTLSYKKNIVKKYCQGKSILDYGCGTGEFIGSMEKTGWNCYGIEPNPSARAMANNNCNFNVTDESGLDNIPESSLDAISLWHVLEHVYPLQERIMTFRKLLNEKGMLFVALPNMMSYDAKRYGRYWAAWDVPRHIHHFNPASIQLLMNDHGFELIKIKPMLLDAFYISMLSEKYKNQRSKNLIAAYFGIRSNIEAFFKDRNYSSLIYIFKKSD